jgi:hypothetical protein
MRHPQGTANEPPEEVNEHVTALDRLRESTSVRVLIGVVIAGAVIIAGIGFAGSYTAVRTLALDKGFGWFANVFPIGVDAGIVVLLSLDLLLTWLRIPFPLLRQTAWLLTAATIAFNGAAAWPDPIGVGMHGIIPVLFVVCVEAARHAIGRVADITADKHMESVRITRWLLAPLPTFRLWRRMKLWELRSYEEVIRREQDRLVYRARLRARYGVAWRRRAPIEALMPLRLARYGVPLRETAPAGLEAAGIEAPELEWGLPAPALPSARPDDAVPAGAVEANGNGETPPAPAAEQSVAEAGELRLPEQAQPADAPVGPGAGVPVDLAQVEQWYAGDLTPPVASPAVPVQPVEKPPAYDTAVQAEPGWGSAGAVWPDPVPELVDNGVDEPLVEQPLAPVPSRERPAPRVQATLDRTPEGGAGTKSRGGETRQRVKDLLATMTPEQRGLTQRQLGEVLGAQLGLGGDAVRRHLRAISREEAAEEASTAPRDDFEENSATNRDESQ